MNFYRHILSAIINAVTFAGMIFLALTPASLLGGDASEIDQEFAAEESPTLNIEPTSPPSAFRGKWYIGVGALYSFEDFGGNLDGNLDWDDSFGFNLKGGYFLTDNWALEGRFGYHSKFESDYSSTYSGLSYTERYEINGEITCWDLTANIKGYPSIDGMVRPYGLFGLGIMNGNAEGKGTLTRCWYQSGNCYNYSIRTDESETDTCVRIGAGTDLVFEKQWGLTVEASYLVGMGDLDNLKLFDLNISAFYIF